MDKNTKILLAVITVAIVLGGLIWVVFSGNNGGINSSNTSSSDYLKSIQPISTAPTATSATNNSGVGDAQKNTPLYVEMVAKFGGNRFQFSQDCTSVTPSNFVIKKNVQFMIDNRDSKAHVFTVAGQKYSVSDYGYVIVSLPKAGTQSIFCDGIQRAKINIQN